MEAGIHSVYINEGLHSVLKIMDSTFHPLILAPFHSHIQLFPLSHALIQLSLEETTMIALQQLPGIMGLLQHNGTTIPIVSCCQGVLKVVPIHRKNAAWLTMKKTEAQAKKPHTLCHNYAKRKGKFQWPYIHIQRRNLKACLSQ